MSSPLLPGTKLGRYEIRSLLGAGGMGEVYLALDTDLDRTVALKILPSVLAADLQRMRRFVQEAKAASGLNHQNIITIYEIGEIDSTRYIATEFVDGVTLRQRITQARLTLSEILDVAIQITSALSAAHEAGIVHRDIKPDNIMLRSRDGFVKVLDFGLVKLTEPLSASANAEAPTRALINTDAGTVMGTVGYMSPEQARGKDVDARTDIFSVGAVVYEMLAGRAPFAGETTADVLGALLHKEPAPFTEVAPDTPRGLQRVVGKALRKDREERYQTAKDLLVDLRQLKKQTETGAELERTKHTPEGADEKQEHATQIVTARPTPPGEYSTGVFKKNKSAAIAVLVLLLLAVGGLGFWYFNDRPSHALQIESIAMLPFQNASGNADVEYLSDGMTESLINSLSQLPFLAVKARSSVFRYKGKEVDPQKVASELSVQAILNGRVVQRGDDLALYLSLVDARTGNQLWGEQYNRKLTDLVFLQQEISRDVSEKLRLKLTGEEQRRVAKRYTDSSEAYELYLKGRYFSSNPTEINLKKSIEYFQQAIDKDPNYALAYAGVGSAYQSLGGFLGFVSPGETAPKGKAAIIKALSIDETLDDAHSTLALFTLTYDWDLPKAEREYKRAIELNPNNPSAHSGYGTYLEALARFDEAVAERERSRQLDPVSAFRTADVGYPLYYARRYERALESTEKGSS
jgi:serine/threonine protein kinase